MLEAVEQQTGSNAELLGVYEQTDTPAGLARRSLFGGLSMLNA
jgi:hypothetical protein